MSMIILANTSWTDRLVPMLIVLGLLIVAVLIGYANYQNAKAFRIESSSSLRQEETLDVLQSALARDGWELGYRDAGSLIMSTDRNPSTGSTAAIGCLSVWLALVHVVSSRKRVTVQFDVSESADGSLIVTNGNKSGDVLRYVARHLHELPKLHEDMDIS